MYQDKLLITFQLEDHKIGSLYDSNKSYKKILKKSDIVLNK